MKFIEYTFTGIMMGLGKRVIADRGMMMGLGKRAIIPRNRMAEENLDY